jgi:hypothetical protein
VPAGHGVSGRCGGRVCGRGDPEAGRLAAALGGGDGQAVGHRALLAVRGAVDQLGPARARPARQQRGGAAAVQVERAVGAEVRHHHRQFGEGGAPRVRLTAVHGQHVHLLPVPGEADGGARGGRVVRAALPVLGLPVHHKERAPADRGARQAAAVAGAGAVLHGHGVARRERGQRPRARPAAEKHHCVLGYRPGTRLLRHGGHLAVLHHHLGDLPGAGDRQRTVGLAPSRGVDADAAVRHHGGVVRVEFGRGAGHGEGAVEVQVEDPPGAVRADADRIGGALGAGLRELAARDARTQRRLGAVDVEEVAVDGGHRGAALARVVLRHQLAEGGGIGDAAGGEVVDLQITGEVQAQRLGAEPLVGLQSLIRRQLGAGCNGLLGAGQLHAVPVGYPGGPGRGRRGRDGRGRDGQARRDQSDGEGRGDPHRRQRTCANSTVPSLI